MALGPFFSEEHYMLRQSIREFTEKELAPHAEEWEEQGSFPDWVFTRLGELGFLGLHYPEQYGSGGGDYFTDIVLAGELSRCGSGSVNMAVAVQVGMAAPPILAFGTEEQKQRCLVPAIKGEKIACLGITEPNAGSDVAGIQTYAEKVPGGWKVNGNKIFITKGARAHFMTLLARTEKRKGNKGMSVFLVDTDIPRLRGQPQAGQCRHAGLGHGGDLLRGHGYPRGRPVGRGGARLLQHRVGAAG